MATSWNEHFYLKLFKSVLYQVSQALPRAVGQFHIPILLVATITKEMMDMVGKVIDMVGEVMDMVGEVIDMVEEVAKPQFFLSQATAPAYASSKLCNATSPPISIPQI